MGGGNAQKSAAARKYALVLFYDVISWVRMKKSRCDLALATTSFSSLHEVTVTLANANHMY